MKSATQWPASFYQQIFARRWQHMTFACASSTRDQAHEAGGSVEHDAGLPFQSPGHGQHWLGGETFLVPSQILPRLVLLVAEGAIFECLWCWRRPRAQSVRLLAHSFFFCVEARTRLRPANATATLYFCRHERERLAIPTRSQP